jgi:hypothetical protein
MFEKGGGQSNDGFFSLASPEGPIEYGQIKLEGTVFSQGDKERLRGQFMAKAEQIFEQAMAQGSEAELNLSQIEEVVGELKFELTSLLVESLVEVVAKRQHGPGPACPGCGQELHYKGVKRRELVTTQGEIELSRGYYYCEGCHQGFFPPGPTIGGEPTGLE